MADMSDLRRAVADRVMEIATEALDLTWRATIDAAPERTGALKHMTNTEGPTPRSEFTVEATIFCLADYAEWTDAGSVAHRVYGNPWLAFFWEKEGVDVVFSTRDGGPAYVEIPAQTGTGWFNHGEDGGEPMASRWERACMVAAA